MKSVKMFTDGACLGNPGPGGWAYILQYGNFEREMCGAEPMTTNNRMELMAAIQAFRALKQPCRVQVITDSEYLKNGISRWIKNWKRNGWRRADKQPVVNQDLWQELDELVSQHQTQWEWTKGHSTHVENNRCDQLASRAARRQSAACP